MHGLTIDGGLYRILKNDEDQYSLWPSEKNIPNGWKDIGVDGTGDECKKWLDENWTDLRPKSLKEKMSKKLRA